jgi:hypothetical protein
MLREGGLAIAMGNGAIELKIIAKWVIGTNDEGGVAQAVERVLCDREEQDKDSRRGHGTIFEHFLSSFVGS